MYEYADIIIQYLNSRYIEEFSKIKSILPIDEINVLTSVNSLYNRIYEITLDALVRLAEYMYEQIADNQLSGTLEDFVMGILNEYDPVLRYVFSHEKDRKAARLAEALIASFYDLSEIDKALRYWSLMVRETVIRVTDETVLKAYRDSGVTHVIWRTEEDDKVCSVCEERDGEIYPIDEIPPKPHYGCRCFFERA